MRFALMIEAQQGLSYEDQLDIARRAEAGGFETLFRSDHYASFPGDSSQPTTDAWAILAGLARETKTIGLGTLVSPVTFRHPGNFVKLVTTVDQMSGGRLEVGEVFPRLRGIQLAGDVVAEGDHRFRTRQACRGRPEG